MDGITDAAMRELQGESQAFTFAVSEFLRVSAAPISRKVIEREVPEIAHGARTQSGMSVQVQLLGGDPELMAESAANAVDAGATAIDINFGCPAPTVNRHDGGASILRSPCRILEIVAAVRNRVPGEIPVSAKVRLGWDTVDSISTIAQMAEEGGANWLTVHARTRMQGYSPPVNWNAVGRVRRQLSIPVIANGDIWTLEDYLRCREVTGCIHFMLGRGVLANPDLPLQVARDMGLKVRQSWSTEWDVLFRRLYDLMGGASHSVHRLKQWMKLAHLHGRFELYHPLKTTTTGKELLSLLSELMRQKSEARVA